MDGSFYFCASAPRTRRPRAEEGGIEREEAIDLQVLTDKIGRQTRQRHRLILVYTELCAKRLQYCFTSSCAFALRADPSVDLFRAMLANLGVLDDDHLRSLAAPAAGCVVLGELDERKENCSQTRCSRAACCIYSSPLKGVRKVFRLLF